MSEVKPLSEEVIALLDPEVIEAIKRDDEQGLFNSNPYVVSHSRQDVIDEWMMKYRAERREALARGDQARADELLVKLQKAVKARIRVW